MSDEKLMQQAQFALFFAPKSERDAQLEQVLSELDSIDNLNNNPLALRKAAFEATRLAYVMGAKWGLANK